MNTDHLPCPRCGAATHRDCFPLTTRPAQTATPSTLSPSSLHEPLAGPGSETMLDRAMRDA